MKHLLKKGILLILTLAMILSSVCVVQAVPQDGWNKGHTLYYQGGELYTGQITIEGKEYLFRNGKQKKGFQDILYKGKIIRVYYDKKTGVMVTGEKKIKGAWYYFNKKTGAMKTGWRKEKGKKYFYDSDGRAYTDHHIIKKSLYVFDDNGVLTKKVTRAKAKKATKKGKGTKTWTLMGLSEAEIIEKMGPLFTEDQKQTGVLASLSLAQFILESWYGRSELALMANNCFGMKTYLSGNTWPGSAWNGRASYTKKTKEEYTPGVQTTITAAFRKYPSIENSIADHSAYLTGARNEAGNLRYAGLKGCTNYKKAAKILVKGGYATSSSYAKVICSIIREWDLTRFDA